MKKFLALCLLYFMRFSLWFRYRVTIKGLENISKENLNKSGGVLFLPNHPSIFVDPTLVTLAVWKKYPIRPVIVEYMFYTPIINTVMRFMNAIPIPSFVSSSNSLKKKKADKVVETITCALKEGENFLIYPAGKTKHQAREIIGGSAVHRIIQSVPQANVVLVRTSGLWGSKFSRALTDGRAPAPMFETIFWGIKQVIKNLIFFTPRRHVTIEFALAPPDFPWQSSRLEFNRYLERWYNRPDGLLPQIGQEPGESLYLVSYSMWSQQLPVIHSSSVREQAVDLSKIPLNVQQIVKKKISEMTELPADKIEEAMHLSGDLGLDSLDTAELIAFLDEQFEVSGVPVAELSTVGKLMEIAAGQISFEEDKEEALVDLLKWKRDSKLQIAQVAEGKTLIEAFLNQCAQNKGQAACGDNLSGMLTYEELKLRVVLLAAYIQQLKGEYIGIMLPSTVAAFVSILACQLAGKIPLMVNWTVGPRHLESVVALSGVQVILSSWAFLDKLENVDLNGIEDRILMLEDLRQEISALDKLKAYFRSKKSTKSLLALFGISHLSEKDPAVLLFTSGTESLPKGVPLSHGNILSNQRSSLQAVRLFESDVVIGMLPPFHAFGFTLSGLLPLLAGIRVAYFPDPTDGKGIGRAIHRWKGTITCGAPSFLKAIFKNSTAAEIETLRLCFTGAEKAPQDLFDMVNATGHCLLLEGYGITECSPVVTVNISQKPEEGVGKPLEGIDLLIVHLETHKPLEQGQTGLVLTRGPNVFAGYLNKGLSSPFLAVEGQEWYSTGDIGYLDPAGNLIVSGRLKRFIKVGGEMISLTAIEDALQRSVGKQASLELEAPILAVCAKEEVGEKPKIVLFTRFSTTVEEANKALKEAGFSNLVKINRVQQLDEIPLMGSGKTHYRSLEALLPELLDSSPTS